MKFFIPLFCIFLLTGCQSATNNKIQNDKIIWIKNVELAQLEQAILKFYEPYVRDFGPQNYPDIHEIQANEFALTFPDNMLFEEYFYLLNYLTYPFDIKYEPSIKGWLTTPEQHPDLIPETCNKKVMMYIPENDTEYDIVVLTTEEDVCLKIDFSEASGYRLRPSLKPYEAPPFKTSELKKLKTVKL